MDNLPLVHKRWTCHCCPVQIDLKQQNISRKRFPIFDLNYWSDQGSSERRRPGFLKHTDVLVLVYGPFVVGEQSSEIKKTGDSGRKHGAQKCRTTGTSDRARDPGLAWLGEKV